MKRVLASVLLTICFSTAPCFGSETTTTPTQVTIKDDFAGKTISPTWSIATGGAVTIKVVEEQIRISGPYLGYTMTGGNLWSATSVPTKDFKLTVDVLEPGADAAAGTYATLGVNGDNSGIIHLQHYAGYYRVAYGIYPNWTALYIPEFGDERTSWHTYKIVYDAATKTGTAFVDEQSLGSFNVDLGNTFTYGVFHHGTSAGTPLDAYFDDMVLRYKP